ncbi:CRISPR-associated helicase/endonuclease Cas3 [Chromobacterium violaceum]|uniref:Helicase Cas3 n=2 Tax=Chromobacterium violaceum TaxID=536 RepID=A0AAX2MBE0_CHRVL|nr:CRISPR-associated helicase/endonuclease Cas3 [Chromobacterium violaceum]STB64594.1 helicase Cas3 [Chromobacterium violaceum]SUX33518.1 helicase Cas3 [Chromobacterium violaceum]
MQTELDGKKEVHEPSSVTGLSFDDLHPAVRQLWAKSGDPIGHGLLCHMLDVAAVTRALLDYCGISAKALALRFGLPECAVFPWLAALVGLHDLGKATPGFQAKWNEGRLLDERAGLPFMPEKALEQDRHDLATASLLPALLQARDTPFAWSLCVAQAVSAHHGFNFVDMRKGAPLREPDAWKQARQQLFDVYWDTVAPPDLPQDCDLSLIAVEWLAGLASVCDWIGSNAEWFPPGERGATPLEHFQSAQSIARAVLADGDKLGWPPKRALLQQPDLTCDELLTRILNAPERLVARPLQRVADALLAEGAGPALMVVEAPMGEGKTELAFLASLRLQARQGHRGIYFALPTQATGNALFERALVFLRAFAAGVHLDIQLAHGGAAMNETVAKLRNVWGDEGDDAVRSSAWFGQRRRGLLSPYGVGTVDQALFGVMNVKHHFVRLWGLADKVVVLDEVHAYDAYTSTLIEALLRWLKGMGCSVILMSATLPDARRARLLNAWGVDTSIIPVLPYPRVLLADRSGVRGETFNVREQQPITVSGLDESLESIAAAALAALEHGGCGAVIVNTVDRAQQLYSMLAGRLGENVELLLFHARFPADERLLRERQVLRTFGAPDASGQRPERALLIATQVAEQSLDIDFDFLISDLAPVDLLLQRAGRLHRHRRGQRPSSHQTPHLRVAGLLPDRLPELKQTKWGSIYGDYLCLVTWAILLNEPVWRLPLDIDRLVQAVYAPWPDLSRLSQELQDRIEMVDKTRHGAKTTFQAQLASHIAIDSNAEPAYAYADKPHGADEDDILGLRNKTRLGEDGVTALPLWPDGEGNWRLAPDDAPFSPQQAVDDALAKRLYARQIKLSRKDVVQALLQQPLYPALQEHALLAHCQPLLLQPAGSLLGNTLVNLDPCLGLVYGPEPKQERA